MIGTSKKHNAAFSATKTEHVYPYKLLI